jgi:hypothetical protein
MARKRQQGNDQAAVEHPEEDSMNHVAQHGQDGYKVGPGCPPREYQWKPGESGNPKGNVQHRTNLWVYFTQYMAMTIEEREKIDRTKLTAAQETALKMVEKAIKGKGCGFERLARYIVNREEGKAPEHLILDNSANLSHEECEQLRAQMREPLEANAGQRSKPV